MKTKNRIYAMAFAKVYPLYVDKAEKKGRTKKEVDEIIRWLTGYTQQGLNAQRHSAERKRAAGDPENEDAAST